MTGKLHIPPVPDHRFPGLAGRSSIVIGGAGGGVGTATVALLVRSGAHVLVIDTAEQRLGQLVEHFPSAVTGLIADVTTDAGRPKWNGLSRPRQSTLSSTSSAG